MAIEIKVPVLPESVADATVGKWHKKPGDNVKRDENLVDIETDKVVLEIPSPSDGILQEIVMKEGSVVKANEVIGLLGSSAGVGSAELTNGTITKKESTEKKSEIEESEAEKAGSEKEKKATTTTADISDLAPSVRRLVSEHDIDVTQLKGSGKEGRIVKEDVEAYLKSKQESAAVSSSSMQTAQETAEAGGERPMKRVPMTRLRARIAERLLNAQHSMAILTTFNEINLKAVMELRKQYKDIFEQAYHTRLGFMSFFVKAAVTALKRFPDVNAFIDGNDIVYNGYYDIGMAVSTDKGLVVPILRDADQLSMAEIEQKVSEFAHKARESKLTIEEMTGGTFTITNGGVFGSLLSTPIINPPQSAILGLHKIEDRPVVENGQIVIRPMMYVALSYDHRIIDGRDSVQFLKTIKELIEDPSRLLLGV